MSEEKSGWFGWLRLLIVACGVAHPYASTLAVMILAGAIWYSLVNYFKHNAPIITPPAAAPANPQTNAPVSQPPSVTAPAPPSDTQGSSQKSTLNAVQRGHHNVSQNGGKNQANAVNQRGNNNQANPVNVYGGQLTTGPGSPIINGNNNSNTTNVQQ